MQPLVRLVVVWIKYEYSNNSSDSSHLPLMGFPFRPLPFSALITFIPLVSQYKIFLCFLSPFISFQYWTASLINILSQCGMSSNFGYFISICHPTFQSAVFNILHAAMWFFKNFFNRAREHLNQRLQIVHSNQFSLDITRKRKSALAFIVWKKKEKSR